MTITVPAITAPTQRRLIVSSIGAIVVATLITVCFVLPVEFQRDPTGFGRITGLTALGTPSPRAETVVAGATTAAHEYPIAFRSDTVDIPLAAAGDPERRDELEYKVRMKAGDTIVYSWSVAGVPRDDQFYFDFHGETPAGPGGRPAAKVMEYKQATGRSANGTLVAPIPGVHGWYLQNQSAGPVVVKLKLSGFYDLVPPGGYGNEAGIVAKRVDVR